MRAWRYGLGAAGIAAVLFGLRGVWLGGIATDRAAVARWLLATVLVHDLLLVPAVAALGALVARLVPAGPRGAVRGGLVVAAGLTLVAWPVLAGRGDRSNASLTPLDYPRNYALLLAAVALGTAAVLVLRRRR